MSSITAAIRLVSRAALFAAERHRGQTQKDGRTPYVNHLAEVADLLARGDAAGDPHLIAAAWLHDAVEDGHASAEDIASLFGPDVRLLVEEMTDDMSLPDEERKERQVTKIAGKSARARLLKLADKTSNIRAVLDELPPGWSDAELRAYVEWGIRVVDAGCRGLDADLEAEFDRQVARLPGGR